MIEHNLDLFEAFDELDEIYEETNLDESSSGNMIYIAVPMDIEKPYIKFNDFKDAKKSMNGDGNKKYKFYSIPRAPFENLKKYGKSDKAAFLNLCKQGICKPIYRTTESLDESLDMIYVGIPVTMNHDSFKKFATEREMNHHKKSSSGYRYQYYGIDKDDFKAAMRQVHNLEAAFKLLQNKGKLKNEI